MEMLKEVIKTQLEARSMLIIVSPILPAYFPCPPMPEKEAGLLDARGKKTPTRGPSMKKDSLIIYVHLSTAQHMTIHYYVFLCICRLTQHIYIPKFQPLLL